MSREETIRTLAHQLWEEEGKPDGRAQEHWARAVELATHANKSEQAHPKRSIDPSEATGPSEPAQPDQT